jgi:TldD protein
MKVAMSTYLINSKPLLRQMVSRLSQYFKYVSILGTDTVGKQYEIQKGSIGLSDSMWVERGFVVRIYNGKNYSEFSLNNISEENLDEKIDEIRIEIQEAVSKLTRSNIGASFYPVIVEEEIRESYSGEVRILPEHVSPEEKIKKMTAIKDKALAYSNLLVNFIVKYEEVHISKIFISNKKELEQSYIWSQGMAIPVVRRDNNTKYSFMSFSGLKGVEILDEMENSYIEAIENAVKLLDAKRAIPGEYEVICSPEISGLIAHEAFGHGVEMDMFVKNRAKAVEYLGKRVASNLVVMHDGASVEPRDVSSYYFDDEGVIASDTIIIKNGILQTGISDTLSALKLGTKPTGNGKRQSFERKAYARMTNTFFAPGKDKLEDMIASIKHGYLIDGMMSGMEDPKNWGIQCVASMGKEIKDGKFTGEIVSPVIMVGYVPDLLNSISMVSEELEVFGAGACGKGYKEYVKVSDGGPYIKTRVRLG